MTWLYDGIVWCGCTVWLYGVVVWCGYILFLHAQVIPATVRPQSITVTVSVPGIQPPYLETLTVVGGSVEVFDIPITAMAVGSERAAKAIYVSASSFIGRRRQCDV